MDGTRSRIPIILALGIGIALGWMLSGFRAAPMRASAGDRAGECIVATGPVLMQYDDATKTPIPLEAVYFLDYKGGRLLATVPTYRLNGEKSEFIDGFAERDLAADFKINLETGPRPRFLMTTGGLGRYSAGWAPLYVFETTTGQVAVYRIQVGQSTGANAPTRFELMERRSYLKPADREPGRG
jgi:hypothetical protein